MKYGIVVDSSCDMLELAVGADIIDFTKVALKLDIGDKEFVDDENLDIDLFMDEMYEYKGKSGSAAPSPADWLSAFEKSERVFALTITSALSGSYTSAQVAMKMYMDKYPDRKIYLLDTRSTGPEMTLIANKIAQMVTEGQHFTEIRNAVNEMHRHIHLLFVLQSLENLMKNGRVSRIAGNIAGILGIKILGCASEEGTLDMLAKIRGKMRVYDKLVEEIQKRGFNGGKLVISHCQNLDAAKYVKNAILEHFPQSEVQVMPTGGLCSFYAERGGMLLAFEGTKK